MDNYQINQNGEEIQYIDPLAILFFFLGAFHLYVFFKRKKIKQIEENTKGLKIIQEIILGSHIKLILISFIFVLIIETYFYF